MAKTNLGVRMLVALVRRLVLRAEDVAAFRWHLPLTPISKSLGNRQLSDLFKMGSEMS